MVNILESCFWTISLCLEINFKFIKNGRAKFIIKGCFERERFENTTHSLWAFFVAIHKEGVEDVSIQGLDNILELGNEKRDLLVHDVRVYYNSGLESLLAFHISVRQGEFPWSIREKETGKLGEWWGVWNLHILTRVVLHLLYYVLGLLLGIDSLVENFDNSNGWESASIIFEVPIVFSTSEAV